ncbi:MAG TPA: beta-L-arabinofuranosidase domain-containing protein [Sumerlaeia bacterium]|nr:beta-L-arabinofuranosidase domain-containing protein [Sumerlaeia bacterium]
MLRHVKVGGEIGRRIEITVQNNLLVLDVDKDFLEPFRRRNHTEGYIGLGKLIDSLVRFAAYAEDSRVLALKRRVVEETIKTQEDDGYIGMFVPEKRMWALWDIHEMAYIVCGLIGDYRDFGEKESLNAAVKLMDYIIRRWSAEPDRFKPEITVFAAVTGLEETLLMLHDETGEQRYLDFCTGFRKLPEWDSPIMLGRWGSIEGHAYAYMHRCLAQLRLHQRQPDPRLLRKTRGMMQFLTQEDGLLVTGACSQFECWHDTQDGTEGLGETCSTAYLIRVLDELIRMENDSRYGDIMERAIYNGLFAAQSPDGRRLRYYSPFEGPRLYFERDTYCCPCNYRRIVAELPGMVYYQFERGLAVNLYAPSEVEVDLDGEVPVRVRQETDYPNSGKVAIFVEPSRPAAFALSLRIPRWCEKATARVNGRPMAGGISSGSFIAIERTWKRGDRVELDMPMEWRLIRGRKAQSGRVAVMRGPQLFCLSRARNEAAAKIDPRQIVIDPATLEGPIDDGSVRPGGMACRIRGWEKMGFTAGGSPDLRLVLTEFPDPEGVATYFRVRRLGQAGVDDELAEWS